jgi:enoyl-[acyl-carrier protein] reductase I
MTNGALMAGKRGLIMGVANDHSIAWGIAKQLAAEGAELAFTYQGEHFGRRVKPLAGSLGSNQLYHCDVEDPASMPAVFDALRAAWGSLDFVVHAIAFSDKAELKGRYADTTRENFQRTMLISCFSFTEVARLAAPLMPNGGALLTLTYGGSMRVMPNYNVMGVAKAALEASVRYLAADFGERAIRVNAVSAGPIRTLAGAGVADARLMFNYQRENAPLRGGMGIEEVGAAALYLLSDLSRAVTGEIHYVDCGYNIVGMPRLDLLKASEEKPTRDAAE